MTNLPACDRIFICLASRRDLNKFKSEIQFRPVTPRDDNSNQNRKRLCRSVIAMKMSRRDARCGSLLNRVATADRSSLNFGQATTRSQPTKNKISLLLFYISYGSLRQCEGPTFSASKLSAATRSSFMTTV